MSLMWYNSPSLAVDKILRKKGIETYFLGRSHMKPALLKPNGQTQSRQQTILNDHTVAVHLFSTPGQLIEYTLDCVLSLAEAHAGSIFLWDESTKELVLNAARGPYLDKIAGARIRLKEGISGWVADTGKSVLVKDIQQDYRFFALRRFENYQTSSFISLPLVADNKLVGVINVTERKDMLSFDDEDLKSVAMIAKHTAIAYENLKIQSHLKKENSDFAKSIHELKETIKQQESFVSVGKLASNLAHELNNPLDAIRRFVNLALDQVMEDSLAREYLLKAKSGIRRTIQVIRGLLSFSRQAAGSAKRTVDLHAVVEETLAQAAQDPKLKQITFENEFCDGSSFVNDCGLRTVFHNLFENACHAMEGKGKITISTRQSGKYAVISVQDTGCGISEKWKNRVFEPFFTTKEKGEGTGIGLAICRDIIERSGGEITFTSEENCGTTFFVMLPMIREEGN